VTREITKMAVALGMDFETAERAIIAAQDIVTVEEMQRRARELNQHTKETNLKRYTIAVFPARLGKPIKTNSLILAHIVWAWRSIFYPEAWLTDNKTGKHRIR